MQSDDEIEEVHGVEIELRPQDRVGLQSLWIDLCRNAGERLYYSVADLVACHVANPEGFEAPEST